MWGTLSILGLYNYDTTIFADMVLPNGVDSATAISSIIMDNAELEILYPDPNAMRFMIKLWSERELPIWERILAAIKKEYDPLENYNRTEEWSQKDTGSNSKTGKYTDTLDGSSSGGSSDTSTRTTAHGKTLQHDVAGFNGSSLTPSSKDTEGGTTGESGNLTHTENSTVDSTLVHDSEESGGNTLESEHSSNIRGNIGVTTSQQMLNQELDVSKRLDIYKYISDSFKNRFCLMVY